MPCHDGREDYGTIGRIFVTPSHTYAAWRWLARIFGVWAMLLSALLTLVAVVGRDPVTRAITAMAAGLGFLWIILGGVIMVTLRDPARALMRRFSRHWQTAFVLWAIVLALLEEAITTGLTNTAPLWGLTWQEAHITASNKYLDVVLFHSVIVFIPMFIAWGWLLRRYAFQPVQVFLLFGFTGTLAETLSFGLQNFMMLGFWVYVYGLMVYLPAYAITPYLSERRPKRGTYLIALIVPLLAAIPVALLILALTSQMQ